MPSYLRALECFYESVCNEAAIIGTASAGIAFDLASHATNGIYLY
jgi:hypothetical protein